MSMSIDLGMAPEVERALNKAIRAAKAFAARREDWRNALFHGENIDITDGHACVRLRVRGARFERSLVPIREVSDVRASLAYRIEKGEEGAFPSLDPLLQPPTGGGTSVTVTVNPELLARVAKLRKALPGEGVTFRVGAGHEPIHFSFDSPQTGIEVEGLIMPMIVSAV